MYAPVDVAEQRVQTRSYDRPVARKTRPRSVRRTVSRELKRTASHRLRPNDRPPGRGWRALRGSSGEYTYRESTSAGLVDRPIFPDTHRLAWHFDVYVSTDGALSTVLQNRLEKSRILVSATLTPGSATVCKMLSPAVCPVLIGTVRGFHSPGSDADDRTPRESETLRNPPSVYIIASRRPPLRDTAESRVRRVHPVFFGLRWRRALDARLAVRPPGPAPKGTDLSTAATDAHRWPTTRTSASSSRR